MRRAAEYIKVFLLLLAVTVASGVTVMKIAMYMGGEKIAAPDVRGKMVIPAMETLSSRGLYMAVTRMENSPTTPKDRIVSQDPPPGEPIKLGRAVKVVVSRGSSKTLIPDITGSSLLRAEAVLEGRGIKIKKKIYIHSGRQERTILAQDPAPGTLAPKGASITLLVSSGPRPERIMAPDFVGQPLSAAMDRIRNSDLRIRRVLYRRANGKESGEVIAQDPAFGAMVEKGSYITLTVSEGRQGSVDEPATYTILYYTVPEGPSAVKVSITQENRDGEKDIYNRAHRPGDTISLLVEIKGRTAVKIFMDNELAEVRRF
ncbi:MAG: PASTA domain-containing protein [Candidatus Nitrospinota bacterium M3_3B_026]